MSQQLMSIRNKAKFASAVALQQSEKECDVGLQQGEAEYNSLCSTGA